MGEHATATPGGARLRALRRRHGKTQLWVELEAELGSGYLHRVESGRVAQPERPTLERVLAALGARYPDRRDVLAAFCYAVAVPLPDETDLAWARAAARPELLAATYPAYVLDCAHRLTAWNPYLPRLLAFPPDDPSLGGLAGRSLVAAWFDPDSPLAPLVAEPDTLLPAIVHALRYELERFPGSPWSSTGVQQLRRDLPRFRRYWDAIEATPEPVSAARALVPLRLAVPGAGLLHFRLSAEPFRHDPRFRLVSLVPADPRTIRTCAAWATPATNL